MNFELTPFTPITHLPNIRGNISRELGRRDVEGKNQAILLNQDTANLSKPSRLRVECHNIPTQLLRWPKLRTNPERKHNLWQSTCFECFIGIEKSSSYIEINVSPSGDWQAYYFTGYRERRQDCKEVYVCAVTLDESNDNQSFTYELDINHPQFVTTNWKISISAVLAFNSGELGYYAALHPESKPDFHLSELRGLVLTSS